MGFVHDDCSSGIEFSTCVIAGVCASVHISSCILWVQERFKVSDNSAPHFDIKTRARLRLFKETDYTIKIIYVNVETMPRPQRARAKTESVNVSLEDEETRWARASRKKETLNTAWNECGDGQQASPLAPTLHLTMMAFFSSCAPMNL